MDIAERRKFYEKVYFFELNKRENFHTKLRVPITLLTFMVSINLFVIFEVIPPKLENSIILISSSIFAILSFLILICLGYYISRVLTGWKYYEVSPKAFERHHGKLTEHSKKYVDEDGNEQKPESIAKKFEEGLIQRLTECAYDNHKANRARNACFIILIQILSFYLIAFFSFYAFLSILLFLTN